MGTSQSYSGITGNPNWSKLSRQITTTCGNGSINQINLQKIASAFVSLLGGSNVGGRGGSSVGGKAGIRTARKIGDVFSKISREGFSYALSSSGFVDDGNKTPNDVINHLLEYCAGVASTLDDTAAKEAERKLLEEICAEAKTLKDLEQNFKKIFDDNDIQELLIKYYAYYIYEHLSIDFYEKLVKEKGKDKCGNLFKQIKDFLFEKIKNISQKIDLSKIKWTLEEGDRIVKNIFEDTLKAFETI